MAKRETTTTADFRVLEECIGKKLGGVAYLKSPASGSPDESLDMRDLELKFDESYITLDVIMADWVGA